jgi:hypothetical protein
LEEATVVLPAPTVLLAVIKAGQSHDTGAAERARLDQIIGAKAFCLPNEFDQQWVRLLRGDADMHPALVTTNLSLLGKVAQPWSESVGQLSRRRE